MTTSLTPIKLLLEDWEKVRQDIIEKNGVSGSLSWRLKREHGWTWRQSYFGNPVEIDFWTDSAKSMFLLTYSHLIAKSLKMYRKNNG
jgi:hypothetical protein